MAWRGLPSVFQDSVKNNIRLINLKGDIDFLAGGC
jgi:hypothetical protein